MALVLAIEPDARQAEALRRVMRERVRVDLVLVDSKDAAVAAISERTPDLILATALLSPRDESELNAHLRALDDAAHLQTLTVPLLAPPAGKTSTSRRLLGTFTRRRSSTPVACDQAVFAEEILNYLERAGEVKAEREVTGERSLATGRADGPPAHQAEPVQDAAGLVASRSDERAIALSEEGWPPLDVTSAADDVPAPVGEPAPLDTSDEAVAPMLVVTSTPRDDEREEETPLVDQEGGLETGAVLDSGDSADADCGAVPSATAAEAAARHLEVECPHPEASVEPLETGAAGEFSETAQLDDVQQIPVDAILDQVVEEADPVRDTVIPVQSGASVAGTDDEEWLCARIDEVPGVPERLAAREEPSELPQPVVPADSGTSPVTCLLDADLILAASALPRVEAAAEATVQEAVADLIEPDASAPPDAAHAAEATAELPESEFGTTSPEPAAPTQDASVPGTLVKAALPTSMPRLAPLAVWARQEAEPRPLPPTQPDDLRALLSRLAVPFDVASVTYPRGCRIRRVRIEGNRPKRRRGDDARPVVILSGSIRADVSRTTAR